MRNRHLFTPRHDTGALARHCLDAKLDARQDRGLGIRDERELKGLGRAAEVEAQVPSLVQVIEERELVDGVLGLGNALLKGRNVDIHPLVSPRHVCVPV